MRKFNTRVWLAAVVVCVAVGTISVRNQTKAPPVQSDAGDHAMNVAFEDLKWDRMVPELGDRSSEIAILRVDPKSKATHLLIRVPRDFHVPKHWHTANETHTIVKGSFIVECEGKRQTLGQGSWNYMPSKLAHEAWTKPNEGAVLFITVDVAWDINWVGGAPKPADFLGGRKGSPEPGPLPVLERPQARR